MDGLSDRTAGRRLGARLRAAAAFAVAACLVWACACVGSGYAARGGGAENVGTRERFLFQPTHTEPRVADGELCCTGNASSRAAYAAVLQRDANDFNAAKGLLVFSAGTEDVTVRGSQDGDTDSCACNVAVVSTKDTRNHPYVLARFTPYSTYAKAPLDPFMFGVVLDRVRITSGDHNSVVYENRLEQHSWLPIVVEHDRARNLSLFQMHSSDRAISIFVAMSSRSWEERRSGGFVTPQAMYMWVRLHQIPAGMHGDSSGGNRNMTISLQSDLCAPGKLSLASAPSVGRDPFLSFSEKVKLDHRKHRHRHKLKLYGYFSWSSPFQLQFGVPDAQAASSLSLEPTENEDVPLIFFDGDNGGDDNVAPSDIECHTLRLNKLLVGASSSGGQRGYGSTSSGGLVQWGFSMGLGVGPPSISTWQRALRNIFVAVLCLAAAVAAIVWYQRRMHKIEMENMGDMLIPLVSGGSGDIRPGALPHGVNAQIQYGGWTNPVARTVSRENA